MLIVYDDPELGRVEQPIGFTCGACGYVHAPGGPPIELRERREIPLYCPQCGERVGSWSPPLAPPAAPVAGAVTDITCAACEHVHAWPLSSQQVFSRMARREGQSTYTVFCPRCAHPAVLPVDPDSCETDGERPA